ncbi:MAG: hypothetical protein J6A89_08460 [Clostridia bacterium]|nr:hypothetical protein [Clostridia bacterium]
MKLIEFKEYNNLNKNPELNKKKVTIFVLIMLIIVITITFSIVYICSSKFRNWADMHILMKTVTEGKLSSIEIQSDENVSIYAYDKYITMLNDNKLNLYNSSAKKVGSIDINISNPLFTSNGKYMVIAEKEKQKIYLISGTKILWTTDIDGIISRIAVNENGYVSIVCAGTTYKSVIIVFDQEGNQLFKTYIPNNSVVDSVISSDNKYLSFAEVDTSGTLIKSLVKTISIKDAKSSSETAFAYTYEMPTNSLIINLKYQGSKNLICMCNDSINLLSDGNMKQLMNFEDEGKNYTFAGIDLINNIYEVQEISDGISNQTSEIKLINTGTKKVNNYSINSIAKGTSSAGDNIAINLGTEIYFINTKGWLKKKYIANQEIRNIIVSDRIAAIIFRDKIEILVL